jgi:flagellar basal-body rod protein FlgG
MLRSMYIAGTGMLAERNRMNVITNNIVNVDTAGFKKDTMISRSFEDMLIDRINDPAIIRQTRDVGPLNTGVHVDEAITSFQNGSPEQTEISTDFCLIGPGFFAVQTPAGERYTRAGNFTLNAEGYLLDSFGNYVQGDGGQIQLESDNFGVREDGTIVNLDSAEFEEMGRLRIVEFENVLGLRKTGDNIYVDYANANPADAENTTVLQGYIETSNVSIAEEMTDMIVCNRTYEANQRALGMIDETLRATVNDIAKF